MRRIVKPQTQQSEIDKHWHRKFNITQFLFDKQLAFVEDPAPFKVAVCSRRSGKTVACAAHLVHTAINNEDTTSLYITLSGVSGKRIIWKEFKKIIKNFNLPVKVNEIDLSLNFPNGSTVYVVGAKDASEIEKFRGIAIKLCYIDECQSFREHLQDLIDDVIGPALMDYAGSLCLIGTPGPIPTGYFYKCAVEQSDWSRHHWTFWDNPFIPITSKMTHQQVFDREMKRRGTTEADPSVEREWFGRWTTDEESLLIKYNKDVNHFDDLPTKYNYEYLMGIDIGHEDADAICILAYCDDDTTTYLVEECITKKQDITALANQIKVLDAKYKVIKMIMDMGALGKKIGEEIIRRHHLPVEAADKTRKMENIAFLNDALRTGRLKARKDSQFAEDSYLVEIDRDKSTPDRIAVSKRYHSDIIDAVLYAFKLSPAYAYMAPKSKPRYGSREWAEAQSNEMWEAELAGVQAEVDFNKKVNGEY